MTRLEHRFAREVREQREARGWTQEELAERANLNRSYVGEIERGVATPSISTIAKLASGLGLLPSLLLARCEKS